MKTLVVIQGNLVRVVVDANGGIPPKRKAGDVGFSSKSRARLMERVNTMKLRAPYFVTLTFHNPISVADAKVVLSVLRKRLVRRGICGLWVGELQKRGVPHFHLLLDGEDAGRIARNHWLDIVNPQGDDRWFRVYGVHWVEIETPQFVAYVAKYMSKGGAWSGRRWGFFGNVEFEPRLEIHDRQLAIRLLAILREKGWVTDRPYGSFGRLYLGKLGTETSEALELVLKLTTRHSDDTIASL